MRGESDRRFRDRSVTPDFRAEIRGWGEGCCGWIVSRTWSVLRVRRGEVSRVIAREVGG